MIFGHTYQKGKGMDLVSHSMFHKAIISLVHGIFVGLHLYIVWKGCDMQWVEQQPLARLPSALMGRLGRKALAEV